MERGEGGYLMFDEANSGTFLIVWSRNDIPNTIAYFKPGQTVPSHKYAQNRGRVELARKANADVKAYYKGIASFIKICIQYGGTYIQFKFDPAGQHGTKEALIYLHTEGNHLKLAETNVPILFDSSVFAIAVVPKNTTDFNAPTMSLNLFLEKADKKGGSVSVKDVVKVSKQA